MTLFRLSSPFELPTLLTFRNGIYLPLANKVWGKVIFLHLCVILFMGGGFPACITGHMTREGLHPGGRGSASKGGQTPPSTTGYGQQAGGTHPT